MDSDQPQKLIIIPERIIPILLKHLMVLKNENAYLKNNVALKWLQNDISEKNIGSKYTGEIIPEKNIGLTISEEAIPEKKIGSKSSEEAIPEKKIGSKSSEEAIPEKKISSILSEEAITEKRMGSKLSEEAIPENNIGLSVSEEAIPEKNIGVKHVFEALANLKVDATTNEQLYSIFEERLLDALNQFIKNGDGQLTLFSFYADFMEAISKKNLADERAKQAIVNLPLEETHILPKALIVDGNAISKIENALRPYLPRTSKWDLYRKIALELLHLHNAGKATTRQLLKFSGLSSTGSTKHLTNLKKYGFIKKQPPNNYVLSDFSKHLLLKLFGVPKNNDEQIK